MSYQVLARKWRPRSFADMVGQQHVVQALSNALDRDRLHHAYLFTGTRGVGKTTLARILAKALNCERGVSSTPCGECSACREVDGGRFVDLLEVDAASRTKVDQTRELLENVPYAPAAGRFKVYLIDEVHMFSGHSFNALLKTLEEPPPHVKFLLATTDPQKVPVTVLSRCLQFNLRRLLPGEIAGRLAHVLATEGIDHEPGALALLARAADGSLRDGLSLLDQAIAFGGGRVTESEVRAMLGSIPGERVFELAEALAAGDGARLLAEVDAVAALTPDFAELLKELIALLHRLALIQQVPAALAPDDPDRARLQALVETLDPADLQLYYQVALTGQQDLPLAPDPRSGFEMVLLRALAFRPAQPAGARPPAPVRASVPTPAGPEPLGTAPAAPTVKASAPAGGTAPRRAGPQPPPPPSPSPSAQRPSAPYPARGTDSERSDPGTAFEATPEGAPGVAEPPLLATTADWHRLADRLGVGGIASQLAHNCTLVEWADRRLTLALDPAAAQLCSPATEERLRAALEGILGAPLRLVVQSGGTADADGAAETPAQRRVRERAERQRAAAASLESDPVAAGLREQLDGQWLPGSIEATD